MKFGFQENNHESLFNNCIELAVSKLPIDVRYFRNGLLFVNAGPSACSDYLSEDLRITKLIAEYAEKDEHYEGGAWHISEDGGPPRPVLMYAQTLVGLEVARGLRHLHT